MTFESLLFRGRTVEAGAAAQCGLHAGEAGFPIRRGSSAALPEGPGVGGWPAGVHNHYQPIHPHRKPGQTEGQVQLKSLRSTTHHTVLLYWEIEVCDCRLLDLCLLSIQICLICLRQHVFFKYLSSDIQSDQYIRTFRIHQPTEGTTYLSYNISKKSLLLSFLCL